MSLHITSYSLETASHLSMLSIILTMPAYVGDLLFVCDPRSSYPILGMPQLLTSHSFTISACSKPHASLIDCPSHVLDMLTVSTYKWGLMSSQGVSVQMAYVYPLE